MRSIKLIAILLAAIMLLGCGCGGREKDTAPKATDAAQSSASNPPSPTDNGPSSTACATEAPAADERLYTADDYCMDYRSFVGNEGYASPIVETDDSIYILSKGFVYFTDKEYREFMPLCTKPNCSHASEDCEAYLGALSIQYRGGYIYFVADCAWDMDDEDFHLHTPSLCRMRLDGTQHEKLFKIPVPRSEDPDFAPVNDWWKCFATGKYFVFTVNLAAIDDATGEIKSETYMFSVDMDSFAVTELVEDQPDRSKAASCFLMLEGKGDKIYGQFNYSAYDGTNKIAELDLVTGETRMLCTFKPTLRYNERVSSIGTSSLYFTDFDFGKDEETLYKLNIESGELTKVFVDSAKGSNWLTFDSYSGYYYRMGAGFRMPAERGLYVCGNDFNVVGFAAFDEMPEEYLRYYSDFIADALERYPDLENADQQPVPMLSFITRDFIFGSAPHIGVVTYYTEETDENGEIIEIEHHSLSMDYDPLGEPPTLYIDKADIGSESLMWKKWEP